MTFSAHSLNVLTAWLPVDRYVASGIRDAQRLTTYCGLDSDSRVLDIGCGMGRLAVGIHNTMDFRGNYLGVDVREGCIRECHTHIQSILPHFSFVHSRRKNERYNPKGVLTALPVEPGTFDIAYLYSVFSHMNPADVAVYLEIANTALVLSGWLFFTGFIEESVPSWTENPSDYHPVPKEDHGACLPAPRWSGPLHCSRFSRGHIADLLMNAGFAVRRFEYASEGDGQSAVYAQVMR